MIPVRRLRAVILQTGSVRWPGRRARGESAVDGANAPSARGRCRTSLPELDSPAQLTPNARARTGRARVVAAASRDVCSMNDDQHGWAESAIDGHTLGVEPVDERSRSRSLATRGGDGVYPSRPNDSLRSCVSRRCAATSLTFHLWAPIVQLPLIGRQRAQQFDQLSVERREEVRGEKRPGRRDIGHHLTANASDRHYSAAPRTYTVAHRDGQTTAPSEADLDASRDTKARHAPAHQFYTRLNQILAKAGFGGPVESLCQRFYADEIGRPVSHGSDQFAHERTAIFTDDGRMPISQRSAPKLHPHRPAHKRSFTLPEPPSSTHVASGVLQLAGTTNRSCAGAEPDRLREDSGDRCE